MQSINLRSRVGSDGILHLEVPVGLTDAELEITITVQSVKPTANIEIPQGRGWPPGFFENTFGCFKDEPLVIDSEGVFDDWEQLL